MWRVAVGLLPWPLLRSAGNLLLHLSSVVAWLPFVPPSFAGIDPGGLVPPVARLFLNLHSCF